MHDVLMHTGYGLLSDDPGGDSGTAISPEVSLCPLAWAQEQVSSPESGTAITEYIIRGERRYEYVLVLESLLKDASGNSWWERKQAVSCMPQKTCPSSDPDESLGITSCQPQFYRAGVRSSSWRRDCLSGPFSVFFLLPDLPSSPICTSTFLCAGQGSACCMDTVYLFICGTVSVSGLR